MWPLSWRPAGRLSCFALLSVVLSTIHLTNGQSFQTRYTKVLTSSIPPEILLGTPKKPKVLDCASECARNKCTGFHFASENSSCIFYKGEILTNNNQNTGPKTVINQIPVFKKVHERCTDYAYFRNIQYINNSFQCVYCVRLFLNYSLHWSAAKDMCESFGASLPYIDSQLKIKVFNDYVSQGMMFQEYWVGARKDKGMSSQWRHIYNNQTLPQTSPLWFSKISPDSSEGCARVTNLNRLFSSDCTNNYAVICEVIF